MSQEEFDPCLDILPPAPLSCIVDRGGLVRRSFFGLPGLPRLAPALVARNHGLQVASLLDLAATKVSVIQVRAELRDYQDVDALLADGRIGLTEALIGGLALYGTTFSPLSALKALIYFEDGTVRELPQDARRRLSRAAAAVDLAALP